MPTPRGAQNEIVFLRTGRSMIDDRRSTWRYRSRRANDHTICRMWFTKNDKYSCLRRKLTGAAGTWLLNANRTSNRVSTASTAVNTVRVTYARTSPYSFVLNALPLRVEDRNYSVNNRLLYGKFRKLHRKHLWVVNVEQLTVWTAKKTKPLRWNDRFERIRTGSCWFLNVNV